MDRSPVAAYLPNGDRIGPRRAVIDGDRLRLLDRDGAVTLDVQAIEVQQGRAKAWVTTPEGVVTVRNLCGGCGQWMRDMRLEWEGR